MANLKLDNHEHSLFRNAADTANEANEDVDLTDWSTSDKLILVIQITGGAACNKITDAGVLKLQYSLDGSTGWTDVATDADIEPAACVDVSGLTDGAAVSAERCSTSPALCSGTFETSGQQACGDATADSFAIGTAEGWTECWFGIDPANATAGQTYYFRLYNVTESTACTNEALTQAYVPSQLTIASVVPTQKTVTGSARMASSVLRKFMAKRTVQGEI